MQVLASSEARIADGKIRGRSPRDGAELEPVNVTAPDEILRVVATAREAQRVWAEHPPRDRARRLRRLRSLLVERAEHVAQIMLHEQGTSAAESFTGEILPSADLFAYWSAQAPRLLIPDAATLDPLRFPRKAGSTELVGRGVVALITPYCFPLSIPLRTLVPALAAGNAVVLKPSEYAARVGALVAELFDELGVPGLVGLAQGGADVGASLAASEVDHVVFVGSTSAGRKVAAACAERLVTCSLQLSGNDPALILADADIDRAVEGVVWAAFANAGQSCSSVERVYVVEPIAETFIQKVVERTRRLRMGNGERTDYDVGPLVRPEVLETVERHLDNAVCSGATLQTGGKATGVGLHFEPTVVTGVDDDMDVMTEETFGPLLPIAVVRDDDEAVARANRSVYRLSASVWTRDVEHGRRIAKRLNSGVITINNHAFTAMLPHAPWHGRRQSGGGITNSRFAFYDLVEPRYLLVDNNTAREMGWFPHNTALAKIGRGLTALAGRGGRLRGLLGVLTGLLRRWR